MRLRYLIILLIAFVSDSVLATNSVKAPWVGATLKGESCHGSQGYGPFDYRNRKENEHHFDLVEGAHFKPDVENLENVPHRSCGSPECDLNYVLRAIPNHHRALLSMIRFQMQVNQKLTKYSNPISVECYLQRAINYTPDDPHTYFLYGFYLSKIGHISDAEKYFKKATELSPNNSKYEYSYANLLIKLKKINEAVIYAKNAYSHGHPPAELKNKLIQMGVWK